MKIVNNINPYIFRGYDIRGVFGVDLNEDVAYTIGRAFGSKLIDLGKDMCVVGHDNRLSSPLLSDSLIAGILDSGVSVVNLGLCTTPMYYYGCILKNISSGVMVTASHNPKDDNGFKFAFDKTGNAAGKIIEDFRDYTLKGEFHEGLGNLTNVCVEEDYYNELCKSIKLGNRRIKVVVDCGNGTTSLFAKKLFSRFDIDLEMLFDESDGNFPNHHPDPSVESNLEILKKRVLETKADVGISFDGDGDRIGIIDNLGNFIPADLYMIMMIRDIFSKNTNKKVLFDVKCSKALSDKIESLGGSYICYRTGNSYTKRETYEKDCILGGELSGHIYFRDKFLGFDSGMYAGLRMIEVLSNTSKTCNQLLDGINKYYATPEIKINVSDDKKFDIIAKIKDYALGLGYPVNDIDGVRVDYPDAWALVRASNTGPNITARFEGKTKARMNSLKSEFIEQINRYL